MKVAVLQLSTQLDYHINLEKIESFFQQAQATGVEMVFLPEVFLSISDGSAPTPYLWGVDGIWEKEFQDLVKTYAFKRVLGTVAHAQGDQVINRLLVLNEDAEQVDYYDKMNLFSCNLNNHASKQVINEADVYTAGTKPKLFEYGDWKIGASICFDLRFPELYRMYRQQGANLLIVPSAFTKVTGEAHWTTLVRARAIENQCYFIAPNQWGKHNEKLTSYGHSLIVGPWGEILADAGESEHMIVADLDLESVAETRQRMDVDPISL